MSRVYKSSVQCLLLVLWKQLVSGGTREKMCLSICFKVYNAGAERMCSGGLFQATGQTT